MPPLITTFLNQQSNAVTHTRPSIALGVIAIKGQHPTDEVYLIGGQPPSGRVSGTTTDESPVLAGVNRWGRQQSGRGLQIGRGDDLRFGGRSSHSWRFETLMR